MGILHGPNLVTDGLFLYLDAGNVQSYPGSGNTWTDLVGSINGTLTNGPTFSSANGGSIVFDGVDDYVDTGITTELNFIHTDATHEIWVNYDVIENQAIGAHDSKRFYMGVVSTTEFIWGIQSANNWNSGASTVSAATDNWYMLTTVADGTTARGYFNGVNTNTTFTYTASTSYNPTGYHIGSLWNGTATSGHLDGKISMVKIYNRALTAAEIKQNYDAHRGRFVL